jgi:lipopolysaccharide/colanic/teichoic acid biosynthesis glycosyltransferase
MFDDREWRDAARPELQRPELQRPELHRHAFVVDRLRPTKRRPSDDLRAGAKRLIDIGLSLVLLIVVSPVMAIIAVALKLDSRGPVIFIQERAGSRRVVRRRQAWWEMRTFYCYKFRSMYSDIDQTAHERFIKDFVNGSLVDGPTDVTPFKLTGDARVTRVGRFLRRMSLDELPQLVNVLKGDMSLVGPRPVPLYEVAEYESWHYERLAARPGITGTWQVYGRGRVSFAEMVRMDIEYVRRPSLSADFRLLVATLPAVFNGKGAH